MPAIVRLVSSCSINKFEISLVAAMNELSSLGYELDVQFSTSIDRSGNLVYSALVIGYEP